MVHLQLLLIFLLFFLPPIDTDLGWHLRYGEYFLKTGSWLRENEFTYFLADYLWTNPFILYEIFIAVIYRLGGLVGLSLAYAGVMVTGFWLYSRIAPKLPLINLLTFLIIIGTSWHVFSLGIRAQIFSLLGVIILFWVVHKVLKTDSPLLLLLFLLPLLFSVWANTHGGFVLGLAVLGLAGVEAVIRMCKPIPCLPARQAHRVWKPSYTSVLLVVSAPLSGVAALINPFGTDIYREALQHARYPLDNLIAEWVPPGPEVKILIAVATLIAMFLVINSTNRQKFFWVASVILFAILTFKARRFIPYFGLATMLGIIISYEHWLSKVEQNFQKYGVPLLGIGFLVLFLWIVQHTLDVDTNWKEYCSANRVKQPCRALEFIRANPIPGKNIFTAYEWGGFLEWQLPQYKYFVDGRMPTWPTSERKSPYTIYLEIIQAQPGYQERLDKYGTDWLLIGAGTFLDIELRTKDLGQRWNEIYRDSLAVIYTKL